MLPGGGVIVFDWCAINTKFSNQCFRGPFAYRYQRPQPLPGNGSSYGFAGIRVVEQALGYRYGPPHQLSALQIDCGPFREELLQTFAPNACRPGNTRASEGIKP